MRMQKTELQEIADAYEKVLSGEKEQQQETKEQETENAQKTNK